MEKKRNILTLLLAFCMMASLAGPAFALEYAFDGAEGLAYGKSTSIEVPITADGGAMKNEDVSKNAARIPPTFRSPTSNTLDTGDYLTPNLAPAVMAATGPGAMINGSAVTVLPPSLDGIEMPAGSPGSSTGSSYVSAPGASEVTITTPTTTTSGYTEVTDDLYYENGSLGTLNIPAIGLSVGIFEGTDSAVLKKGAGHFEDSSIWDGNVALCAHNRGANSYFGEIHNLQLGDTISLTTRLGTRNYEVTSVSKVSETDRSALAASGSNQITLYTCVRDEREFRWCVQGVELV